MPVTTWVLVVARLLHIVGGITWVGAVLTSVFFIEPTGQALGTTGLRFVAHLINRRQLTNAMAVAAVTAIGAGAVLYWIDSDGPRAAWITSHTGLAFTAGALAALSAFALAAVFLKPGFERLASLADEGASDRSDDGSDPQETAQDEAERLEMRLRPISLIQVILLVLAAAAMAAARYLP
jgi:hypothetical protein